MQSIRSTRVCSMQKLSNTTLVSQNRCIKAGLVQLCVHSARAILWFLAQHCAAKSPECDAAEGPSPARIGLLYAYAGGAILAL